MRTYAESCRVARVEGRRIPYLRRVGGFFVRINIPIINKRLRRLLVALLLGQTPQLDGELRQLLFGDDLHAPRDRLAIQELQLRQARDDVVLEARPVRFTRVAHHVQISQVFPFRQVVHAGLELVDVDEMYC